MGISKLKISAEKGTFEVKINPSSFNVSKGIKYTEDKTPGTSANVTKFARYGPDTLSFDFILDSTGIAYAKTKSIDEILRDDFENVVYTINGETHAPNVLMIAWGRFGFKCQIESVKYDYTLFNSEGEALRVKVSASFSGYTDRDTELRNSNKKSPDLSRIITLRAGETISGLCNEIYGDPSYCMDIARYNRLSSFRNVQPGTKLAFPPLARHE